MKRIDKKLSELPKTDSEKIRHTLYVKSHLDELIANAVKHDKGENLKEELRFHHQRFDMYMANKIRQCETALCVCYRPTDEYFVITKSNQCFNISRLIKKKGTVSLSQWIHMMSREIFKQKSIIPEITLLRFEKDSSLETIIEVKNEALSIINENNPKPELAMMGIMIASNSGQFEPLPPHCDLGLPNSLNELHIYTTLLYNILRKYPLDFDCMQDFRYPLGIRVLIDLDFDDPLDVFMVYKIYRSKNKSPFDSMKLIESTINKEVIRCLSESESVEYKLWV